VRVPATARTAAFYDYVLVQGAVDPWDGRQGALGPLFVPIARAGVFTLLRQGPTGLRSRARSTSPTTARAALGATLRSL